MQENVRKEEVEEQLGYKITDKLFEEALNLAEHKQKYIYEQEQRAVVLQHLCRTLCDMEKGHPIKKSRCPLRLSIL